MTEEYIEIKLPNKLAGKLAKKIEETGFSTITEYVVYILEQAVSEGSKSVEMDEEEEKRVKKRLRELGYF